MMDFTYALANFREGEKIQVSDGTEQPPENSPSFARWKARNFTGKFVRTENQAGEPVIVLETGKIDLGDGHSAVSQHFFSEREGLRFWRSDPHRADVEALKRREINVVRDAHIQEGVETSVGKLDADPTSISNVTAAAVRALIAQQQGADFSEEWTTADNKVVKIKDAETMLKVADEALSGLSRVHADARASKALLRTREMTAEKMLKLKFK